MPAWMHMQSDPAAQGRQASGAVPKERHTSEAQVQVARYEVPREDTACSHHAQFGHQPQEVATPQPEDFSSSMPSTLGFVRPDATSRVEMTTLPCAMPQHHGTCTGTLP